MAKGLDFFQNENILLERLNYINQSEFCPLTRVGQASLRY